MAFDALVHRSPTSDDIEATDVQSHPAAFSRSTAGSAARKRRQRGFGFAVAVFGRDGWLAPGLVNSPTRFRGRFGNALLPLP